MTTKTKILIGAGAVGLTGTALYFLLKPSKQEPQPGNTSNTTGGSTGNKSVPSGGSGGSTGSGSSIPSKPASPQYSSGTKVFVRDMPQTKTYKGAKIRKRVTDGNDAYKGYVGEEIGTITGATQVVDGTLFSEIKVKTVWGFRANPFGGSGNRVWVADMFLSNSNANTVYPFAEYLFDEVTGFFTDEDGIYKRAKSICKSDLEQLKEIFSVRYSVPNFEGFLKSQAPNLDVTRMLNSFTNC